jgi:HTH-type transcriptional regulator, cell division transcriptional repressor
MKPGKIKNASGKRIYQTRRSHYPPVSQGALVRDLVKQGVPMDQGSLSRIESRRRKVSDLELIAIAKCLGVCPCFLLLGKNCKK